MPLSPNQKEVLTLIKRFDMDEDDLELLKSLVCMYMYACMHAYVRMYTILMAGTLVDRALRMLPTSDESSISRT
jgi:hypothetical protein